jgi:hypothetical protein
MIVAAEMSIALLLFFKWAIEVKSQINYLKQSRNKRKEKILDFIY